MTTFTQTLDQFRVSPSRDGARQVLQFCQARPERYAQLRDDDEAMIHFELTDDAADPMRMLAEHYAECWNALEDAGLEPTEEALWEVEEELAGGGWTVHRDDDDGLWKVSRDEEFEAPRSVAYHRGSPDRYTFNPSQPRDDIGRWTREDAEMAHDAEIYSSSHPGDDDDGVPVATAVLAKPYDKSFSKQPMTGDYFSPEEMDEFSGLVSSVLDSPTNVKRRIVEAEVDDRLVTCSFTKTRSGHSIFKLDFEWLDDARDVQGGTFGQKQELAKGSVDFARKVKNLTAAMADAGLVVHWEGSDERRAKLYWKMSSSIGLKKVVDSQGVVFWVAPDNVPLKKYQRGDETVLRYEWITIGGHPEEPDKKHVGGFPVEIDSDGTILKSRAPGIQGKHIGDVKGNIGKKKNVDQPDQTGVKPDQTGVKPDEPESGRQETGSEEKPKWNAESTAIRHIAGSTGLEKNDVISQIAQIAMKTGWGTAKIAGRIAKTLGKHALGTVGIGSGKRASMILDLVDDLLGKDNAVTNAAMGRNVDDKQSSAVLDAVDAMFGKDNPLSTAHHQVKPEKKKEKPKESSAVLDVVDAVLGKGNAVTNAVMNEGGGETSPQSSVLLDAVDAVAGKGNAVSNAASGIGGGSKQSSLLLDIWDSIAGKGNKVTDWLMRQEHDGKAYRRELLDAIDAAASECETEPTDAQKESGNYKKGHVTIQGLPITIENPKGSIRRGKGWQTKMKAHYGYVKRTESEADGDHVDVFIGPDPQSEIVFVVDQLTKGGRFDEHKCMIGYTSAKDAKEGYLANYSPGWTGYGGCKSMPIEVFKEWIKSGDTGSKVQDQKIEYSRTDEVIRFEKRHAPKGGATIGGKFYEGGEWIPAAAMAKATKKEKDVLAKKTAPKAKAAAKPVAKETAKPKWNAASAKKKKDRIESLQAKSQASSKHKIDDVLGEDRELRLVQRDWSKKLKPNERQAIIDYVTPGAFQSRGLNFRQFNQILRDKGPHALDEDGYRWYTEMKSAMNKAPAFAKPVKVYRGLNLIGDSRGEFLGKLKEHMDNGWPVQFGGFTSSTLVKDRARDYADQGGNAGVLIEIEAKTGAYVQPWTDKFRRTEKDEWSQNYEVLNDDDTSYEVAGIRDEFVPANMKEMGEDWHNQLNELNSLPDEAAQQKAKELNDRLANRTETLYRNIGGNKQERYTVKNPAAHSFVKNDNGWVLVRKYSVVSMREMGEEEEEIQKHEQDGEVLRYEVKWVEGKSKSNKTKWTHPTTGEVRYQPKMPGDKSGRKKAVRSGEGTPKPKKAKATKTVDKEALREKLQPYDGGLNEVQSKSAKASFKALMRHHSDKVTSRLSELVDDAFAGLGKAKTEEARQKWTSKLSQYRQMLDWAGAGVKDSVQTEEWGTDKQPFYRPGVNPTVDNIITRDGKNGEKEILLIQRKEGKAEGGKWALPGGFHDTSAKKGEPWKPGYETAEQAALRELAEETGLDASTLEAHMKHVGDYEGGGRDPRDNETAWSKSSAFALHLPPELADKAVAGLDDASDAKWVPLSKLNDMSLAFDHGKIIDAAIKTPIKDGMVESGETLKSKSGRRLSPIPKISTGTDRKTGSSIKRIDEWLLTEARAEVEATEKKNWAGKGYLGTMLSGMNAKNLSKADKDTLNDILFGNADGPTEANRVKEWSPNEMKGIERDLLIQRVIAKFGGDEQKYSSYSTEQLRKMLEGGTKGETNDDTNSSQLDGDGELAGGGGEDSAGSTVGTDAGQASKGVLPESGDGDGGSLSGLPDGEGQPGAGASAVPDLGEGDGAARGEGGSSEGASTSAGGTGGSGGRAGTEGDRSGGVPDVPGSDGQTKQVVKKKPTAETPTDLAAGNYRYTDTQAFMQGGLKAKFGRNIEAIRTLKMLQEEGRQATPAEQEILSKFIGWGQFPAAFERGYGDDQIGWQEKEHLKKYLTEEEWDARFAPSKWEKEKELLKSLLTDDEYKAARKSTLNAHYTHPDVVKAHWKMAERLGFKGGKFLETSAGAGYYMGMMPGELAGRTRVNAVELDPITAAICKQLYPKANVENTGFEKFANPDGFYELVASNVPFGDYSIYEKRYAKYGAKIHDHFFLKSLDLAKPGGLVMHVTSTGTLDKQDATIRKALAEGAEFVGAVRFPGSTHKKNAGTEVVTDMVILRKKNPKIPATTDETPKEAKPKGQGFTGTTIDSLGRLYYWQDGKRVPGPSWLETTTVPDPAGGEPIPVNKYFADHPEQVLGTLDRTGTMYRADSKNVSLTDDFEARLEAAIQRLPEGAMRTEVDEPEAEKVRADDHTGKENSLVSKDGKIYVYQNGMLTEQKTTNEERQKIEQLLAIRDARNLLVANQLEGTSSAESRKKLNELYDAYVAKNGIIHSKKNMDLMGDDPDLDNLLALERYDKKTKKATKADMLVKDTIRSGKIVEKAENITEAVGVSLHMHGLLDVGYMSKILGMTKDEVGGLLAESGLAFNDPKEGWKQNDQYLSGNVRKKLIEAKAAAAVDPAFRRNVEALESVQPADIPYDQITIKMGARWVPESDMQNFAVDLFGGQADMYEFRVNPIDSKWSFDIPKNAYRQRLLGGELAARWGTDRVGPSTVLNAALNNTLITVSDKHSDGTSSVNKEATDAANEKVKNMRDQFSKEFVWEDEERRERLSRYYNDNYNNIVPIKYDGSHQTFPGQNAAWKLYPHQKDAVWQIVTTGKGLLAHEVGTGKSATMFTSAMELRRLGLAKKPAIVCLKTNIAALTEEARQLYPGAKILSTLDSFDAKSRKKTMAQIATGDYDMVFMTHEHLGFMKMKPDTQKAFLQKELDQIMESMAAAVSEHGAADYSVKQLEAAALKVTAKMQSSMDDSKKDDTVYFEDSGIDQIMVDEAHYFKNLGVYSKNQIKGIPTATSDRALDMYMRSSWLMEKNNGRGVVFATGTPVSNSMAELYVMQKYLQEAEMKESGINNFDDWANMYGDTQTKQEYTMTGEYKPVTRFSEFTNVPELLNQARQVMDVVRVETALDEKGEPTVKRPPRKDKHEVAPPLPNTAQFLASLQSRARSLGRDRKADNMLKICSDAKKFSVDMRLIDQNSEDYPESKVNILVNKTIELWKQHPDKVQFIFSDAGVHETDTNSFTCYDDITQKLIDAGIPADKIKNFGKIDTEKQKEEAVQALRSGEALIAIGGTKKLGTGVNAQNKMIAIHHLDVPMRPSDIEQREGRGWRSGNKNDHIDIIKYVAQPMDQFFWGLVSRKDKFIKKVIIDKNPPRNIEELEDADDLSPDRLAAIASGNPLRVRQVELEYDEKKLADSERRHTTEQRRLVASEKGSLAKIARLEEEAKKSRKLDQELPKKEDMPTTVKVGDKEYDNQKEADEALKARIAETANLNSWEEETIGEYAGMPIIRKQNRDFSQGIRTYIETPIGEIPFNDSIQSLKLKISGARNDYKNTELAIEEVKKGMAKVKESVGKPYANAEKLATIRAELKKIAEELAPKKDEDTTTVVGSGSAALDDYLKDVKKDGGEDPRGQTIIKKPQAVIPPTSEFTSIHDVDTRVKSFGKAIKAPADSVKLASGKTATGHAVGPFVIRKEGDGKNTRYIVTHKGTGFNAVTADTMSVANVAAHAMAKKGDWSFTDASKFTGETREHGGKVVRAVNSGNMQDLADLAGIGEHTVQRNQRMPWNFKTVLNDFRSSPDADGARKVLRYCAADVSRYAMIEDADAANIEYELTPEEGGADHFRVLAEFYADHWNQLERAGLEPSNDGLSKAADELANGDWVVFFDEDDMEWRVIHAEAAPHVVKYAAAKNLHTYSCPRCKGIAYADSPVTSGRFNGYAICSRCGHSFATVNRHQAVDEVLYYATRHAPKGGVTINGKFFKGGKFIPGSDMAKATPKEKKVLDAKTGGAASKASGVKWNAASKRDKGMLSKAVDAFDDNITDPVIDAFDDAVDDFGDTLGIVKKKEAEIENIKVKIAKADVAAAIQKAKEATADREKAEAEIRKSFDALPEPAQQAVSDVIEKNKESLMKKIGNVASDVAERTLSGVGGIGMGVLGVGLFSVGVSAWTSSPFLGLLGMYDGIFDAAGLSLQTGFKMLDHATRRPGTPEEKKEEPWQREELAPEDDPYHDNLPSEYRRTGNVLRYEALDDKTLDSALDDERIKKLAEEYYTGIVRDLAKVWKPEWNGEEKERYSLIDVILRYARRQAPKGGVHIGGKAYKGGQWIPAEVMAKATPKEKAAITKAASPSAKATTPGKAVSPKQVAKASVPKTSPVAKKEAVKWNAASKRKKADPKAKILELAKGMNTASIPEIRAKMPVELRGKEFDDAIIALADDRKIQVHSDALPESFSPEERANLTSLGNNVFTSFSVTPSVGMDMVNKSAIPEEAKKDIGELHNEFMKMDPEQQQRILQKLEAAARKYDQKQNLSKFVSTRAYAGLSPSQRKNAEEAFMILDPEQQAERLEVLNSMTPEQIDDAVRQANELDRQKHNTKPDTITWGGVKGGRFKPEELKADEDEDLTQMSEDDLWNAFVGEQGGNPHLPKHQWTPRAHKLMDAWRKKSEEVEAAAKQPAKESMLEKTVAGVGDFAKKTIENLNPLNMKSHALDLASNVVDRIDGSEVGKVIGNIASNMIHNSTNYQRGGVLRHYHEGMVLRYEWVEVPTKAKTKKWKDSATGRTRYQPTQPGVGRGGGIMSKGVQATATTGGTITRTKERGARGQVDREKLKQLLQPHGHHELDEKTMKKTKSQFRALAGHHKELVHHRLEELANGMQSALEKLPDNAQNRETRQEIGRKLRAISHMTEWADAKHPQQTKKEPSVGKLSSKINSGKFNLAERGKGLKPSELKQYPTEKQEMKHADPVMQKHQDDHDAYLEAQAKKTIHVQTGADKPKKSVIDPSKSMWDLPGDKPEPAEKPAKAPSPQNMHGQEKKTDARGWPKGTESWAEPAPAKSSVQTEKKPETAKKSWNEPQKRVKKVHETLDRIEKGQADKRELQDVAKAVNEQLNPKEKEGFWKRVVKSVKKPAQLAMLAVSLWGAANAGVAETKEIAAGKKDPIDKSSLAFELHKRAEGMAGKPREERPGIVKTSYQRAE